MIGTHLLITLIVTGIIKPVGSCGDIARESFRDPEHFCDGMKQFTMCITRTHDTMGSPFGHKGSAIISKAVKNSLKKLCNEDCKMTVKKNIPINATLLPMGDALKACGFDLLINGGGKKRQTCNKLEETATCMIRATTEEDYLLTNNVIDVGTYVLAQLVHSFLGVQCPKPALETRLSHICIGYKQARKYS